MVFFKIEQPVVSIRRICFRIEEKACFNYLDVELHTLNVSIEINKNELLVKRTWVCIAFISKVNACVSRKRGLCLWLTRGTTQITCFDIKYIQYLKGKVYFFLIYFVKFTGRQVDLFQLKHTG